jgi:hypothetical protein
LYQPDEEVTRGHHATIKLLVAAWSESANFPHQPDMIKVKVTPV